MREEWASGHPAQLGKTDTHSVFHNTLHIHTQEKSQAARALLVSHWAVPYWGKCDTGKAKLTVFLQYSKHSISDFLLQRCAGNSPLNSCSSLRLSCLWVIFLDQCVSTQMPREAEASSQATSGFAAENEVYMPITNAWVRRLLDPLMYSTKQNQT